MGITILRSGEVGFQGAGPHDQSVPGLSLKQMFFQGAMVTAGNPKAIVFFTAVFPQFIHPGSGFLVQCSCLLGLLCAIAFVCFMLYALGGQRIVCLFSRAAVGRWVKRAIGTSFIGAGIGLAFARR